MRSIVVLLVIVLIVVGFGLKWKVAPQVTPDEKTLERENGQRPLSSRSNPPSQEARSVSELTRMIDQVIHVARFGDMRGSDLAQQRDDLIAGWSLKEVEAVCRMWMIAEDGRIILQWSRGPDLMWRREMWVEVLFRRWGELSPEAAFKFVSEFEAVALAQTGTYDDTWASSTPLGSAAKRFSAVMVGWSTLEPWAAYEALNSGEVSFSDSKTFDLFYPKIVGGVFENLSRVDTAFTIAEFMRNKNKDVRSEMLGGIADGIPISYDFQQLFGDLKSEIGVDETETKSQARGKLLGRWLESDADGAMSWYQNSNADWLMPVSRRSALDISREGFPDEAALSREAEQWPFRFEDPLSSALRNWFLKSPVQTIVWLQNNRRFVPVVVSGGSGYNFTSVDPRDLRNLLVNTLPQGERERYLLSDVGQQQFSNLVSGSRNQENLDQIKELQLSESVERDLSQKYLKRNPDPFETGADPFATEGE